MTMTHERLAGHAAWSFAAHYEDLFDAIEADRWIPEHFTDPELRLVAELVLELVLAGEVPWPEVIVGALVARGIDHAHAVDLVVQPGAFEASGYRLDGLGRWLAELERDHVRRHLVAAGHALEARGGIERARDLLREVAA
jgi:hypothetical protein